MPILQANPYNEIIFQTAQYAAEVPLEVTPTPDTQIRVFMAYRPLTEAIDTIPQVLPSYERSGFTLVEWGGGVA
ncbi:MAG: hypothetical protein LBN42_01175 [Oscillospiraceae bacterium]|nr:hypothetical protein [Oscillospiraceae bacterium]